MKRIARVLLCCVAATAMSASSVQAETDLDIGSKAPSLDLAHYYDESDAKVTDFKKGNVYVVEFWATWCPPCVASMPHLAELQQKYRGDKLQIVSISDEDQETVSAKLKEPYPGKEASFAEVTAPYTLTSDPDGSAHRDYMLAAKLNGIPAAFVVGKTGLVEWIGHPMEMDEPLAQVLSDSWDREAFKKQREEESKFEETLQEFAMLAGRGKVDEAAEMLDKQISGATNDEYKQRWVNIQHQFRLLTGTATEADFEHYRSELKELEGNGPAVLRFAMQLYGISQNDGDLGPLTGDVIAALETEVKSADAQNKAAFYEVMARYYALDKNFKDAVAAQEKAMESAGELSSTQKRRMELLLDELKKELEGGAEAPVEE